MAKHQKEARSTNRTQSGDEAMKSRTRRQKSLRLRQAGCLYPVRFRKGRRWAPIITSGEAGSIKARRIARNRRSRERRSPRSDKIPQSEPNVTRSRRAHWTSHQHPLKFHKVREEARARDHHKRNKSTTRRPAIRTSRHQSPRQKKEETTLVLSPTSKPQR